jgi:tRNA modification GTPase
LSAKTGQGLDRLRRLVLESVGWKATGEGLFIARERHLQLLQRVQYHLQHAQEHFAQSNWSLDLMAEELRLAQLALGEITGEFTSEDLLGIIFTKFCIGK